MDRYTVPKPMPRPDYVFYHTPTVDEMRQRAVQAIKDFLSIQWRTHTKIAHSKRGAVSHKRFIYEADNTYCGLPYADGGKGLFQFYEFYDEETGRVEATSTDGETTATAYMTEDCYVMDVTQFAKPYGKLTELQVGDIMLYITAPGTPEQQISACLYVGEGRFLRQTDAGMEPVEEDILWPGFIRDIFVCLRPALAAEKE